MFVKSLKRRNTLRFEIVILIWSQDIIRNTEELEKKFCLYMRNKAEETDKEMYEKFLEALKSTNYALDNFKNGLKQLLAEHST